MDKLGIPEPQEGEAVLGRTTPADSATGAGKKTVKFSAPVHPNGCGCGCQRIALSAQAGFDAQSTLDNALDEALTQVDFNAQLNPMIKQAVALLVSCRSFEEASDKLATLYPKLHSEAHFDCLSKAMFLSELLGVANFEHKHGGNNA